MTKGIVNHRLSERQKRANDFQAAKDVINHFAPEFSASAAWIEDYDQMLSNYRLINNQIEIDDFTRVCNPLGISEEFYNEEVLPFNKIHNKVNVLLGEELSRNESFAVTLLDDDSIVEKDIELQEHYLNYIKRKVQRTLTEMQMKMEGADEETIKRETEKIESKFSPEELSGFKSESEITVNSIISYGKYKCDFKNKKNIGYKHMIVSGKEKVWVGFHNGKIDYRVVNPIHYFNSKSPDVEFDEDGDAAGERRIFTTSALLREFGNELSKSEIERLSSRTGKTHLPSKKMDYNREDAFGMKYSYFLGDTYLDDYIGQHGHSTSWHDEDLHWVTHVTWKWERKVGFLSLFNEWGEEEIILVDDAFKIPKEREIVRYINQWGMKNKKYVWYEDHPEFGIPLKRELEWIWVPRVWEGTRIDSDIYINIREVPYQPTSINDPWNVKLPYHGIDIDAMNAKPISPVSRMKPFQFLYFVVMNMFLKLIARNYGSLIKIDSSQIDPELGDGDPNLALERTLGYMREGVMIYNSLKDAETGADVRSYSRPSADVVNYSNTLDILNMTNLLNWLDVQIGMGFGISPQREAQFSSNTNVGDNQQAIMQSVNITQPYFFKHNELWRRVIEYYVNAFKLWAKDMFDRYPGRDFMNLHYVLPNGSSSVLKLTKDNITYGDIGLFITNYGNASSYIDKMEQLALTFVQNDRATLKDISMILKSKIDGSSPEEIHHAISQIQKKFEQKEQQAQNAQREMLQAQQETQKQIRFTLEELKNQHKIEQIIAEGEQDRLTDAVSNNQNNN